MSDMVSNGYLKDKNGKVMEIVDKAARDGVERLTEEIADFKENPSSGLPEGAAPNQFLVTDAGGVAKWEDRTHFEGLINLIAETTVQTKVNESLGGGCAAEIPALDEMELSDIYVEFNGEIYGPYNNEMGFAGNMGIAGLGEDTGEPFVIILPHGWVFTKEEMEATLRVYRPIIKPLENKFLRGDVAKYGAIGEITRIEWDGEIGNMSYITHNTFRYYKVASTVIPPEHIVHAKVKRSSNTEAYEAELTIGTNCYKIREVIVVTELGNCTLDGMDFTASSTGIYFLRHEYTSGLAWVDYAEIDTRRENAVLYLTNPSGAKYAITIDDSGTLTATEIT